MRPSKLTKAAWKMRPTHGCLTSTATLSQKAEQQIETLARNAELKLRETFTQVFASVGDSLRERLLGVTASMPSSSKPAAGENSENK